MGRLLDEAQPRVTRPSFTMGMERTQVEPQRLATGRASTIRRGGLWGGNRNEERSNPVRMSTYELAIEGRPGSPCLRNRDHSSLHRKGRCEDRVRKPRTGD